MMHKSVFRAIISTGLPDPKPVIEYLIKLIPSS